MYFVEKFQFISTSHLWSEIMLPNCNKLGCEQVDIKLCNKMYSGLCAKPSYRPIAFSFMQQNCKELVVEIEFCFRSLFV